LSTGIFAKADDDEASGWTILVGPASEGTSPPIGIMGVTPVFVLVQTDAEGNNYETVGVGEDFGVFVTHTDAPSQGAYSVAGFAAIGGVGAMGSVGTSRGDVVLDIGVIVENPATGDSIEISREFNPTEALRDTFQQMFGGLSDYRNYRDPLLY